jgi:hypothetical protein
MIGSVDQAPKIELDMIQPLWQERQTGALRRIITRAEVGGEKGAYPVSLSRTRVISCISLLYLSVLQRRFAGCWRPASHGALSAKSILLSLLKTKLCEIQTEKYRLKIS